MSWLKALRNKGKTPSSVQGLPGDVPPDWTPAPERSHTLGLRNEASDDEYASAEAFCARHPLETPKLLSSDMVERIDVEGRRAWTMEWPGSPRFIGSIHSADEKRTPEVTKVTTADGCGDVCLLSNLPLLAGLYEIQGKSGVYYEVRIQKMNGIVAIGTFRVLPIYFQSFPNSKARLQALYVDHIPTGGFLDGTELQLACIWTTCASSLRIQTVAEIILPS